MVRRAVKRSALELSGTKLQKREKFGHTIEAKTFFFALNTVFVLRVNFDFWHVLVFNECFEKFQEVLRC